MTKNALLYICRERERERGEKINKKKLMGWSVQQKTVTEVLKKLLSACRF